MAWYWFTFCARCPTKLNERMIMTSDEFNEKWSKYLEDGFYGLAINHPQVIKYLDKEFTKEVEINPSFTYAQIKMKFGKSRVYANSEKTSIWEKEVDRLVNVK